MKGLICELYKSAYGDSSNDGISSRCKAVTLILDGCEVFEANEERPAVKLVKRQMFFGEYVHAEPVEQPKGMNGPMFGGCYIKGDSRFPNAYPIPLHDRFEVWEGKGD